MRHVFDTAVRALQDGRAVLFLILTAGLTLLASVLGLRAWRKRCAGDLAAALSYFASFFILCFAAPLGWLLIRGEPAPASLGLAFGNWRAGLILVLIGVPVAVVAHFTGRKSMGDFYPFSRQAMTSPASFLGYETAYFFLYYVSWEFAFRGVILFSLASLLPQTVAGAFIAILVQTALSTVFHIGHPDSEIGAALLAGVAFGIVALSTGSILYTLAIHATIGMFEDVMAYVRHRRQTRAISPRA